MRPRDGGFILVVVLWTMALLALIATQMTGGTRLSTARATALRAAAVAAAAADGLVSEAIFHLLDSGPGHWEPNGQRRPIRLPRGEAEVIASREAGRINLNTAPPALLAAVLEAVGVPSARARPLAMLIYQFHLPGPGDAAPYRAAGLPYTPPGTAFRATEDLGLIPGIDAGLIARLGPHVTAHGDGRVDPAAASPFVRRILHSIAADSQPPPGADGSPEVVRIEVVVRLRDATARRLVIVRPDPSAESPGQVIEILRWQ